MGIQTGDKARRYGYNLTHLATGRIANGPIYDRLRQAKRLADLLDERCPELCAAKSLTAVGAIPQAEKEAVRQAGQEAAKL